MQVTELIELAKTAIKEFDNYKSQPGTEPLMTTHIRHSVSNFSLAEGSEKVSWTGHIFEKPEWASVIYHFIHDQFQHTSDFKELRNIIAKKYKTNINKMGNLGNEESVATFWLERYITTMLHMKLEGKVSKNDIIDLASTAKSEMEQAPKEYKILHYLKGIYLKSNSVRINDNTILRKPRKADLEYSTPVGMGEDSPIKWGIPSAILEVEMITKDSQEIIVSEERIFNALRLYRLGSVHSIRTISSTRSAIGLGGTGITWGKGSYSPVYQKYIVQASETARFVGFINSIEPKLSLDKGKKEYWSLCVSCDRYNSAILESTDSETRLMTAVMGLEALYTLDKDVGENSFKLGIRVARLLSIINFNASEVRNTVVSAYSMRNKIVHGVHLSDGKKKEIQDMLPDILNYLRLSLVIFILNRKMQKNLIVTMIDEACINVGSEESLKKLVLNYVNEFKDVFN